jgi:2-polyprenyl-3-methyl-5-hydroxy-6-metoxy-1,4-benzoquinol methylase
MGKGDVRGENVNTSDYWNEAWARAAEQYRLDKGRITAADYIKGLIPEGASVLDIGGGCGLLACLLRGRNKVKVIDFSKYALEYARSVGADAEYANLATYVDERYGWFDYAVCTDFLEHLDEPQRAIKCAYFHADRAIFAVPDNCMGPDSCQEHVRVYDRESLARELRSWSHIRIASETIGFNIIAEVWK